VHDLADLAMKGKREARRHLEKTAMHLGVAIRGLAHGLSPEVIVVGGQITEAWPVIKPVLRRELHSGYLIEGLSMPELRRATVERPALFGAVPTALRSVFKTRTSGLLLEQ
jgi:predicted NBD/HSP70 family sugar kinase